MPDAHADALTLYRAHQDLADRIGRAHAARTSVHGADLVQAARLGLWQACLRWDPTRAGDNFAAFASQRIRWAVIDGWRVIDHLARQRLGAALVQAQQGHQAHHKKTLERVQDSLRGTPTPDVLRKLSIVHGLSWSDLSRLVGVSIPAIRKWRRDTNGASEENRVRLLGVLAFLDVLKSKGIDATTWLDTPFFPEFTVAPKHVFSAESTPLLIDNAIGSLSSEDLLDSVEPTWREDWRRQFVTVVEDGEVALVSYQHSGTQ